MGPLAIFPASFLIELVSFLFHSPLVPFISGHLFGDGFFSHSFKFAFITLAIVFYPAILFVGVPAVLFLRHFEKPGIYGLIAAPLAAGFVISLIEMDLDFIVVILFCAISVASGCWLSYRIVRTDAAR